MTWITDALSALGPTGVFVLMGLESAGAPIPAEIVLPFAGYLVFLGRMSLTEALVAANLGGLAGFALQYLVGRLGGRYLLAKYGRFLLITPQHLEAADRWFARYGGRAVFWSRMLPVVRGLISLPAGAARMRFGPFLLWSVAGAFPFTIALVLAGWVLGALWPRVTELAHSVGWYLLAAAELLAGWWLWRRRDRQRRSSAR